ncbi:MAG: 6-carboxytetrahydropterin synthase [Acidobacteriaceae bacterium]|nr:6-carboxytetrahydropterin synthase [Acidobacteriaceae bacterium]MBV9296254.1 6-carboxytetrahydropterin synthase [Acidobacteriaceae bacterium]MBV9764028.1 6-carboxytetrahydropterin synthase [Acidobacteriaceae bacterium]
MTTVTRRYEFSASHRLHSPELSDAENARLFGKCNNPFGHGHNYVLDVTVAGAVDPSTGLILPLPKLDNLIDETVLKLFDHRNINLDVPQFAERVPTTENVILVILELLRQHWNAYLGDTAAQLLHVRIQETERNFFEV